MEIVTGSTGEAHVTPIDDAVRNTNFGYYTDKVVFDTFRGLEAIAITANEVRVYGGYGMNQGRIFKIDRSEYDSVTIENGSQGVKRADLIVARYIMNSQTGFEGISLAVIKGQSGQVYTDPSYTTGNINEGATEDDFPLYRVKVNGIVIEAVEPLFTPLPAGGRFGFIEKKIDDHINDTEDPHRIAWTEAIELTAMSVADTMAVQFGKIAKAITSLIAHITNKNNPHEVGGTQLTNAVPISKGGTGATTAAQALVNLGVPSDIADAMSKAVYTDATNDTILVSKGGTGRTSVTAGSVLVGNGANEMTERSIDSTSGGTASSNALITSGAVNAGISAEATARANAITALRQSFTDGCNAIAQELKAKGVTPSKSGENYTPTDFINAIDTLIASQKRAVAYSISEQSTIISTWTENMRTYHVSRNVVSVNIGGVLTQHSYDNTWMEGGMGANDEYFSEKTWTQNV